MEKMKTTTHKVFIIRPQDDSRFQISLNIAKYVGTMMETGGPGCYMLEDSKPVKEISECTKNIEGIREADKILVWWKNNDDDVRFAVGVAFGLGKDIRLINSEDVRDEEGRAAGKSFGKVLLRLNDEARAPNSEIGGVKHKPPNDAFLICRVRNAPQEVLDENSRYVAAYNASGRRMYYPPVDIDQTDTIGFEICKENRQGIRNSKEVHVKWSKESKGSLFDLGMAIGMGDKRIVLVNDEEVKGWDKLHETTPYDQMLLLLGRSHSRLPSVRAAKRQA
jgi:hypothetical protein